MRLLLDTHIALWAIVDDARLPQPAADLIADPTHAIVVSAASVWEIAIKHSWARGHVNDRSAG
jgi:PIN domain nuclease of toxin-antitoxin system